MLKRKDINLLFTFYKNYAAASVSITLIAAFLLWKLGIEALTILFWFKITATAFIGLYIQSYKRKEFFYYQNLGISRIKLWVYTIGFDLLVFVFLMVLSINLR